MTAVHREALVPYRCEEMFALVDDVEAYPGFLPWCRGAQVLSRDEDLVEARLEVARGSFQKSFTTRNRLRPPKMIEMRLVEGPFRHLEGFWRFEPVGEGGCRVSLDLEFEFAGRLVGLALGPVFRQIADTLVDAFCRRAVQVYGRR